MIIELKNANVFDPQNKIFNKKKNILIKDGKIVNKIESNEKLSKSINCKDKIVMPGAIDLHTHIGGGKVNIARLMFPEFHDEFLYLMNHLNLN